MLHSLGNRRTLQPHDEQHKKKIFKGYTCSMWYNTYLVFDFLVFLKSLTISHFCLQQLKHWQHWLETNFLQNPRWMFPEKRGAPCPLSQLFLGRRRIICPVLLLSATEKTRTMTRRYTVFVIDFMKFIDYICCSVVTVKHKCLLNIEEAILINSAVLLSFQVRLPGSGQSSEINYDLQT